MARSRDSVHASTGMAEGIRLPGFRHPHSIGFTACGDLQAANASLRASLKALEKKEPMIASYRTDSSRAYVRALWGGKGGKHIHLDFSVAKSFRRVPKPTCEIKDIVDPLAGFLGQKINVAIMGVFIAKLKDLPKTGLIRPLLVETKSAEASVKMIGGRLLITGAPVQMVEWSLREKGKTIRIFLTAIQEKTIAESYFEEILSALGATFDVLILEKKSNG